MTKSEKNITILIVEDHTLLRENWVFLFSQDSRFRVLAQCGSGEEAVSLCRQLRPDIVLMDISLPGMSGLEATSLIKKYIPSAKVIGVSLHAQFSYAKKMMQSGASGYITKNSSKEELLRAIVNVYQGQRYLCAEIKDIVAEQVLGDSPPSNSLHLLTDRERDIIRLVKEGYSSKQIGTALHISHKTVDVHRVHILKKLNLKNTAALVNFINKAGME